MEKLYIKLAGALVVAAIGAGIAWAFLSPRLDAAVSRGDMIQAKFGEYVQQQIAEKATYEAEAADKREKAANAWAENLEAIREQFKTEKGRADAYRRCVDAGRCGPVPVRVCYPSPAPAGDRQADAVPAAGEADASGQDAIPFAAGVTAECSETTGQLNALQADIEAQPNYFEPAASPH